MLSTSKIFFNYNPIDMVESLFSRKFLELERRNTNEVVIEIEGKWNNMLVFFAWEEHLRCLHISCLMNINTPTADCGKIFELLALINENLWLGHFAYWSEHQMPIFKHSIILNSEEYNLEKTLNEILEIAVNECEHMYPIFNAVLTQNISPQQALFSGNPYIQ